MNLYSELENHLKEVNDRFCDPMVDESEVDSIRKEFGESGLCRVRINHVGGNLCNYRRTHNGDYHKPSCYCGTIDHLVRRSGHYIFLYSNKKLDVVNRVKLYCDYFGWLILNDDVLEDERLETQI